MWPAERRQHAILKKAYGIEAGLNQWWKQFRHDLQQQNTFGIGLGGIGEGPKYKVGSVVDKEGRKVVKLARTYSGKPLDAARTEKLRTKTPSDAARNRALANAPRDKKGEIIDPIYGGIMSKEKVDIDHIVAFDRIIKMPGFSDLTYKQQLAILDMEENLMAISSIANRSKKNIPFAAWGGHSQLGPVPPANLRRLILLETKLEAKIQATIDEMWQQNFKAKP